MKTLARRATTPRRVGRPLTAPRSTTWSRLDRDLRRHEYRLGQAAAYSQPDHTTAAPRPASRAHHRCRTVAVGGRRHRGLPEPLGRRRLGRARPRTTRPRTACPLAAGSRDHRVGRLRGARKLRGQARPAVALVTVGSAARPRCRVGRRHPRRDALARNHRHSPGVVTATLDATSATASGCDRPVT